MAQVLSAPAEAVLERVEAQTEALVELCLDLGNTPDLPGHERQIATAVVARMRAARLEAFLQPVSTESANAVGVVPGVANGRSLIIDAHMDTEGVVPSEDPDVNKRLRGTARHGDLLIGKGLGNDKGQLCAALIAAGALLSAGIRLRGDLIVVGAAQETGGPPPGGVGPEYGRARDEYLRAGPHMGEGFGTLTLVRGGVLADYAIVAEATGFTIATAQGGYVRLRIAVEGHLPYTPYLRRGEALGDTPNPIEKAAQVVLALEQWARTYERDETYQFEDTAITPKAQVHDVRTSGPLFTAPTDVCYLYLDVRLAPGRNPMDVIRQVRDAVSDTGLGAEVLPYDYGRGYAAKEAEPLVEAVRRAHRAVLGFQDEPSPTEYLGMWRDSNIFNEVGIPSISYGPPTQTESVTVEGYRGLRIEDLVATAKVYALAALEVCGTDRVEGLVPA
jgi:acetylornithine deacetylase/succinyl-diaminopimelate desuccinylase-like protein